MDEHEDWEQTPDEEAPEQLRRKWEIEELDDELQGRGFKPCPHCRQLIEQKSFSCIYCGETVFRESGPIGRLGAWLKDGNLIWVILLIIMSFLSLMMFF